MTLTELSIKRPSFIVVIFAMLFVLGIGSYLNLKYELLPKFSPPVLSVITVYPGAGPKEVETNVTKPIEDVISGLDKLKSIRSTSSEGVSIIITEFDQSADIDQRLQEAQRRINAILANLPQDVKTPTINKFSPDEIPILTVAANSNMEPRAFTQLLKDQIVPQLSRVAGVAQVSIVGSSQREIKVNVNKDKLRAYGISIGEVSQAVRAFNLDVPTGRIKDADGQYVVRVAGKFNSMNELRNLVIRRNRNGADIKLADLADVEDGTAEANTYARLNGKYGAALVVQKQNDANSVEVARLVKEELKRVETRYAENKVSFELANDSTVFTTDAANAVQHDLLIAIMLVALVCLLFLHSIRDSFIVMIAIPCSFVSTFLAMYALGYSLNLMTMLGLSLVVGILVDDSIVVLENIHRHLEMGKDRRTAALEGRNEIGFTAMSITLVDVVVFAPLAFQSGIVGNIMREFAVVVVISTLMSLFVSFTVTPALASRLSKVSHPNPKRLGGRFVLWFEGIFNGVKDSYGRTLGGTLRYEAWGHSVVAKVLFFPLRIVEAIVIRLPFALFKLIVKIIIALFGGFLNPRNIERIFMDSSRKFFEGAVSPVKISGRRIVFLLTIFLFFGSFALLPLGFIGGTFIEQADQGKFIVLLELAPGAKLEQTDALSKKAEAIVRAAPEVLTTYSNIGSSTSGFIGVTTGSANITEMTVILVPKEERKRSTEEVRESLRADLMKLPGIKLRMNEASFTGGSDETPLQLILSSPQPDSLRLAANRVLKLVKSIQGTTDVRLSSQDGKPEAQINIDREKMTEFGLNLAQVGVALRTALTGDDDSKYRDGNSDYNIRIQLDKFDRSRTDDLGSITFTTPAGKLVELKQFAQVNIVTGPSALERFDRNSSITVNANVVDRGAGDIGDEIEKKLPELGIAKMGVSFYWEGDVKNQRSSNSSLGLSFLASILFVYLIMVALYDSYIDPFVVLFSIPVAMVGALLALAISMKMLTIFSILGIIMMVGLVAKNAILLVDFTNQLRERGMEIMDALVEAGRERLRPIVMTTFAMVFGMLPIALASTAGSEWKNGLAWALVGGLSSSMFLTLFLVPCVYFVFERWLENARRFVHRYKSDKPDAPQPVPAYAGNGHTDELAMPNIEKVLH